MGSVNSTRFAGHVRVACHVIRPSGQIEEEEEEEEEEGGDGKDETMKSFKLSNGVS